MAQPKGGESGDGPRRDPDTLPTQADKSGKCPRCGRVSNFDLVQTETLRKQLFGGKRLEELDVERVSVLSCQGCFGKSVVVESRTKREDDSWYGVVWWPAVHLDDLKGATGVPSEIAATYSEGVRCVTIQAPNAAVAMFRTSLAQIIEEKASATAKAKNTLFSRIEQMVAEKTLWESFGEWAHHIRDTGNAGAHGEKFDPVTTEQAAELQRFIRELINFLYEQPARLAAAMPVTKKVIPADAVNTPKGVPTTTSGSAQS